MVRVGVDENLAPELLAGFPCEAEIVRIPRGLSHALDVDFWILPFHRRDAAALFAHLRGVRVVQSMMAGVDWITPWLPSGVTLCDGRGLHDISASEWVLGAILASLKQFPLYRDAQTREQWLGQFTRQGSYLDQPGANRGQYAILADDLAGKTVLILGYGSIGAAIEARLNPFGVEILRVARSARILPSAPGTSPLSAAAAAVYSVAELDRLLPAADIVIVILPLTPETRGLVDAPRLALLKPGALLVNAARGPVVAAEPLLAALQSGRLRAALDVTDPEPLPAGHPLWIAPNCLITPHIGGSTPEFIHRAFRFGAAQVERFLRREPLENIVTSAGY